MSPRNSVLFLDLALSRAGGLDLQVNGNVQRGGVCDFFFSALLFGVLRLVEVVVLEGQLEPVPGLVFDGRDLLEQLAESVRLQPVEGAQLDLQQVWNVEHRRDTGVRNPFVGGAVAKSQSG